MSDNNFILVAVTLICAVGIPIAVLIWWKKKTHEGFWPFVAGAFVWVLFTAVLEQIVHMVVFLSENPLSLFLNNNIWAYALYGGLAAGVFEETGRLVAFKLMLKDHKEKECSIAYGIGHGGMESIYMVGSVYLIYLFVLMRTFNTSQDTVDAVMKNIDLLTPGISFTVILERILSMIIHVGLSVMVFKAAVRKGSFRYYPLAVGLHTLTDIPAVLYQQGVLPIWSVEVWSAVMAAVIMFIAVRLYKNDMYEDPDAEEIEASEENIPEDDTKE